MTFQKIITVNNRRQIEFKCDQCGKIYEKRYCKCFLDEYKLTFCSMKCSSDSKKKGNLLYEKSKKTCLIHYGVSHSFKSENVKLKCRNTWMKKYGVENPFQSDKIKEKCKEKLLEHYGVENPAQSDIIQKRIKETNIEKYGVSCPLQTKKTKDAFKELCLQRYGVDHNFKSNEIKKKRHKTWVEKYGVDHPSQSEKIKEKFKQTCLEKYGVDHHWKSDKIKLKIDYKLAALRCHETMKKNGTYGKSKAEDLFYRFLCEKFGKNNVERQVRIHDWSIDFYIKTHKIYIQFDGVYWHGLDRPIEIIKEFKNPRDKVIYETYLRDQEQNKWFKENNLKLVRVKDKDRLNISLFHFPRSS